MFDLKNYMEERRERVNAKLDECLPRESERPALLHRAMRYSVLGGGKRIRPILVIASAEAFGGSLEAAMPAAAAIECLHTYSLIHDDLPAMDNDDLRRGKATLHKAFGEANAILAGDSLLTLAFELLGDMPRGGRLTAELARAAGSRGLAGGQFEDLDSEGVEPDLEALTRIHTRKTASLVRAACRMGAIIAGAADSDLEPLSRYGEKIGLAFQIVDDILNATSTPEVLGKAVGSDLRRNKMSYVALAGTQAAIRKADTVVDEAVAEVETIPGPVTPLVALARFIVERES